MTAQDQRFQLKVLVIEKSRMEIEKQRLQMAVTMSMINSDRINRTETDKEARKGKSVARHLKNTSEEDGEEIGTKTHDISNVIGEIENEAVVRTERGIDLVKVRIMSLQFHHLVHSTWNSCMAQKRHLGDATTTAHAHARDLHAKANKVDEHEHAHLHGVNMIDNVQDPEAPLTAKINRHNPEEIDTATISHPIRLTNLNLQPQQLPNRTGLLLQIQV